ncbi:hypothetical protein M0R45_007486 [Rubus argutus]|uniref:FBD domain-containing protein n=1 Tax=Rubus argutus TaxID=59490 RepID=A0AAW1Y1T7_RUBAR
MSGEAKIESFAMMMMMIKSKEALRTWLIMYSYSISAPYASSSCFCDEAATRDIDRWLTHLSRNSIKELYLSLGALPEKLPKPCPYLRVLSIDICFDDPDVIPTALCLLRSSPVLQELEIFMDSRKKLTRRQAVAEEVKSFCLNDNYNCTFSQLRLVKMTEISGVKAELEFIRFLLLSSPVLERMTVQPSRPVKPASVDGFSELVKELLQFKRDSKRAEIILLDP